MPDPPELSARDTEGALPSPGVESRLTQKWAQASGRLLCGRKVTANKGLRAVSTWKSRQSSDLGVRVDRPWARWAGRSDGAWGLHRRH